MYNFNNISFSTWGSTYLYTCAIYNCRYFSIPIPYSFCWSSIFHLFSCFGIVFASCILVVVSFIVLVLSIQWLFWASSIPLTLMNWTNCRFCILSIMSAPSTIISRTVVFCTLYNLVFLQFFILLFTLRYFLYTAVSNLVDAFKSN